MDLLSSKLAIDLGAMESDEKKHIRLDEAMTDNLEAYRYYSLGVEKAQAFRNGDEFRKGLNLHLLHHSMAMSFDGSYRCPQLVCDLLVDLASNDKVENLSFPRGQKPYQASETIQLAKLTSPGLLKSERAFDGADELIGGDRLGQDVLGAGLDCLHRGRNIGVAGQKDDRQGRAEIDQPGLQVRAA
jgi:hypothetical protein